MVKQNSRLGWDIIAILMLSLQIQLTIIVVWAISALQQFTHFPAFHIFQSFWQINYICPFVLLEIQAIKLDFFLTISGIETILFNASIPVNHL